ncbi:hypothetical protein [Zhihengliuella sp.]|uniref:hypothetical protein n=1 Tax=Zhihengliuella sp. TaxID=1954483 RepID=UPI002811A1E6|nr:hypothetical protein [Zhihengliuella sp.]
MMESATRAQPVCAGVLAMAALLLVSCSATPGPRPAPESASGTVLAFDGAPEFVAGTYTPLEGSPDILRQGALRPDAAGCLTLVEVDGTAHPILFPRGTRVLEDGTLQVPGRLVHRPDEAADRGRETVEYRVGEEITGSGPEISGARAREGAEGAVLPDGCYPAAEPSYYLLVP